MAFPRRETRPAHLHQIHLLSLQEGRAESRHFQTGSSALACATPLPLTCWKRASISAPFRSCSATAKLETTARYLHVADTAVRSTTSPLELLDPLDIVQAASTFQPERMNEHRLEVADVFRTYGDDFLALWERVLSRPAEKSLRRYSRLPHSRFRRPCGPVRSVRALRHLLQLVSQSQLPEVSGRGPRPVAGRTGSRVVAGGEYFHVVFTLPQQIAGLALQNARRIYSILFRAVAETLLTIAADPKHLGAAIGFLAVLHTWGQNLHLHPHIHCVVPGGGNQPRQLAMDPLSKYRKSFFLPGQGPQSLLPQEVPDSSAKGVPEGQTSVPRRTGIVGPTGGLRGIVSEGRP